MSASCEAWSDPLEPEYCRQWEEMQKEQTKEYKVRLSDRHMPCEKCGRPTGFEVETFGRWANWCGCK